MRGRLLAPARRRWAIFGRAGRQTLSHRVVSHDSFLALSVVVCLGDRFLGVYHPDRCGIGGGYLGSGLGHFTNISVGEGSIWEGIGADAFCNGARGCFQPIANE